ncbi:predicted protein [Chaetoceros tenuissimus]|uniref:Uncharacterized protein n=1 Tax=Chaetoceros tenuissimus TaxID=426638 RepID=A0AAD3CUS8_9STRA|nr:predicted protein [Chaetoceros tenuissimus]
MQTHLIPMDFLGFLILPLLFQIVASLGLRAISNTRHTTAEPCMAIYNDKHEIESISCGEEVLERIRNNSASAAPPRIRAGSLRGTRLYP